MTTSDKIKEDWKKAYSKMTGKYIGDEILNFWLAKLSLAISKREEEIVKDLTDFDRPTEPPYALNAFEDREKFRKHIISLIKGDKK